LCLTCVPRAGTMPPIDAMLAGAGVPSSAAGLAAGVPAAAETAVAATGAAMAAAAMPAANSARRFTFRSSVWGCGRPVCNDDEADMVAGYYITGHHGYLSTWRDVALKHTESNVKYYFRYRDRVGLCGQTVIARLLAGFTVIAHVRLR